MTPDFLAGIEHAKKVALSLSVQPPEPGNRNEEYMYGVKQPVLKEFQDVLSRKLDEVVARGTL